MGEHVLGALVSTVDCWMCVWGVCAWCFGEYCRLLDVCMGSMCLVLW